MLVPQLLPREGPNLVRVDGDERRTDDGITVRTVYTADDPGQGLGPG